MNGISAKRRHTAKRTAVHPPGLFIASMAVSLISVNTANSAGACLAPGVKRG